MDTAFTSIAVAPLLPWWMIAGLGATALLLCGFAFFRHARGAGWRSLVLAFLLLALVNPSLVEEQRRPQSDVALLVVDDSDSQTIGGRAAQRDAAVEALREQFAAVRGLELRVVRAGAERPPAAGRQPEDAGEEGGTRLFGAIERALADVPPQRRAGSILVTDGQVHDAPAADTAAEHPPLHVLLTGRPGEGDRALSIVRAPGYGIVGSQIELTIRVDDLPRPSGALAARVSVSRDGKPMQVQSVMPGREETIRVPLEHAGETVVELAVEAGPRELTEVNNRAVVVVQGVRDRLRVLLVSGQPHAGERVWRNLLKSDPAVDLIHFTILRPPEKQDATPIRELSLIAFPIRELFETKLHEFDLIIFDRYSRRGVIPQLYLGNIARYVQQGGALLEAVGPGFAEPFSTLYRTPLGEVLPSEPTGRILEGGFRPGVTAIGERHPVTADLRSRAPNTVGWGRWFRHVDADPRQGATLMTGAEDRPLLILDRVGEGRVGQLLSDHIWLWARGYEGGGPHGELLRRLAHWLMKEPDLEENALHAHIRGDRLLIERRTLEADDSPVTVTAPDGSTRTVRLTPSGGGRMAGSIEVDQNGLYRAGDGVRTALAAAGPTNPLEYTDVRATPDRLEAAVAASDGAIRWLAESGVPELRRVRQGASAHGRGWLGLRENRDYTVAGVKEMPLLPPLALLLLVGAALVGAWRREAV